jgi:transcriptional regulator with XRE-family HTH domain
MPRPTPPPLSLTLTILRTARGWSQGELAQAAGTSSAMLSDYETGRKRLSRARLERFAEILSRGPGDVDDTLSYLHWIQAPESSRLPVGLSREDFRDIERAAATVAQAARDAARLELTQTLQRAVAQEARQQALEAWEKLKVASPSDRRALVDRKPEYQTWAFCERLCAESERAAAADAGRAVDLANLALRVAGLMSGEEEWRARVQGYAWAHVGNARRVASDLPGAEIAFDRARRLWQAGADSDSILLDEGLVFDMEASLRRDQRRFPEALELQERALAVTPSGRSVYILLNLAFTLEQMGEHPRAVEALENAALRVDWNNEPRLLFALRFNLAVNLCHLGRYGDATRLLSEVRGLAVRLRKGLDLIRVNWLESRVATGQGRRAAAIEILNQVRSEFVARALAYDSALASLDLAVLYLQEGRTRDVKTLAREMAPIFQTQGVHREALAALRLFCEAAEQEAVTLDMARRLVDYLERSRHNPDLRFTE